MEKKYAKKKMSWISAQRTLWIQGKGLVYIHSYEKDALKDVDILKYLSL